MQRTYAQQRYIFFETVVQLNIIVDSHLQWCFAKTI